MDEGSLLRSHRLEAQTLLILGRGKDSELSFLGLTPLRVLGKHVERIVRVRDMNSSINMRRLINVQRKSELAVPLETGTFVVTGQGLATVAFACLGSATFHFLFLRLTKARDEDLALTRFVLFARIRGVACGFIWVTTCPFGLSARLRAAPLSIFTFARTMAGLGAEVRSTLQLFAANTAASDVLKPALLIFHCLLATHASFLHKERAFGTRFVVLVAVVRDLWMSTVFCSIARRPARWRSCATW